MEKLEIAVGGMSCEGCVKSVSRVLSGLPGVSEVSVSLADAKARLMRDPAVASVAGICAAVQAAGFEASESAQ